MGSVCLTGGGASGRQFAVYIIDAAMVGTFVFGLLV